MPRGSQPGERRGGRKKGTLNRITAKRQELAEKALTDGQTPLEYMLAVMRDETVDPARRDDMAKAAGPYVHPKLAAIEHTGKDGAAIEVREISDLDAARRIAFLLTRAAKAE